MQKPKSPVYQTMSGVPLKASYGPSDVRPYEEIADPGEFPYTRGVHQTMYRGKLWTMRMFAGFGTPEQTNERFKYLLAQGQTGLSTAFDFPTLMGYDSDSPLSLGEVGMVGVAVDTLRDMEVLFDGIPLDQVTTSMTINGPAIVLLAFYVALADKRGISRKKIGGTVQNDCLKEFIAQHAWLVPPRPAMRVVTDMIEFCSKEVPRWNSVSISGYHIREAGATAAQELAFTLADGIAYVQSCLDRGLDVRARGRPGRGGRRCLVVRVALRAAAAAGPGQPPGGLPPACRRGRGADRGGRDNGGMTQGTARFQDKRDAILDGAARLFNAQGVKGGMLSDVARQVGLATNSLTYYYRKKEALAEACLLRSMQALGDAADAAAQAPTLAARVQGFLERYLSLLAAIAEGRHPELIVFSDLLTLDEPYLGTVTAAYTQMFRRVRQLLQAPDAPALSTPARNARAHLLLSTTSWARAWLVRYESDDYARVAGRMADLLLNGLCRAGQWPGPARNAQPPRVDDAAAGGGDAAATRAAYLRAATRLVNEHGYHGASVDRIAAELQLTKGSFYHHHETKEDLIAACFERTFAVVRAAQTTALDAPGNGRDRLADACRSLLAFQLSEPGPLLRITAWTGLPDAMRRDTRRTMARLGERFATLVIDGMADGSLRIVDPSVAAQMINGMINAVAEIERWVRGIDADNAFGLYAMPLFSGLCRAGPSADPP